MNFTGTTAVILLLLSFSSPAARVFVPPLLSWQAESIASTSPAYLSLQPQKVIANAPTRKMNESLGPVLTARTALVKDVASGAVLFQKNQDEVRSIASITKLMTLMVVLDRISDRSAVVEITSKEYVQLGYNNFIVGEKVSIDDLIAATVIASDNTAVTTLAHATGLSDEAFVRAMNERARALGLVHTTFADPTGLSAANVSTANEVIVFARKAFEYPAISRLANKRIYAMTSASGTSHTIKTTNQLIGSIVSIIAGKTGFVTDSGYNIVAQVINKEGRELFAVVLGSASNPDRFQDLKMLVYWAWLNYTWSAP